MGTDAVDRWDDVTSWHVEVGEKTTSSSLMNEVVATLSASGTVSRDQDGSFSGTISGAVFQRDHQLAPEVIVEDRGSESWEFSLSFGAGGYTFNVGLQPIRTNVRQKAVAVATGQTRLDTSWVPWSIIGNVTGDAPPRPGPITGQLHADDGSGAAIWTLTPTGGGRVRARPGATAPAAAAPAVTRPRPRTPTPPPKPPRDTPGLRVQSCALEQFARLPKAGLTIDPLRFCSVGAHAHFGGMTRFYGTLSLHGRPKDVVSAVHLDIFGAGGTATGDLSKAAAGALRRAFPGSGTLAFAHQRGLPALLFEVPSAATQALVSRTYGTVELRVRAETAGGENATLSLGRASILVEITDTPRFPGSDPDEAVGGDDWVLPSVKTLLEHYGLLRGDCSHMNGGPFSPHSSHRDGCNVDLFIPGYQLFDAACAQHLIDLLDDPQYGYKITACGVYPNTGHAPEFWRTVRNATLADGRAASEIIVQWAGHSDHFHWRIDPNRPAPRRRPRRPARPQAPARPGRPDAPPRPRRSRGPARIGYAPPIEAAFALADASGSMLHVMETCPALERARAAGSAITIQDLGPGGQDLATVEAEADRPVCGTCLAMYRADVERARRDGVLDVGRDAAGDALVVYTDRVGYQIGDGEDVIPADELVTVTARRMLGMETATLVVTGREVAFTFGCRSVAERDRLFDAIAGTALPGVTLHRGGESWES